MKAYSRDLRIRALDALDLGTPRPEVIRLFGVSTATLTRWRRRQRETGSLAVSRRPGPPGPKLAGLKAGLLPRLQGHPDATLEEHCQWWEETRGVRVSHATMSRVITQHFGWTRKKSLGGRASAVTRSGPPGVRRRGGSSPDASSGSMKPAATSA
jgi:transposase